MIPPGKFGRIAGAVPKENSKIVHPGSGKEDIVIAIRTYSWVRTGIGGNLLRQTVEARLMTKFIARRGLLAYVGYD
jgi:hypothetical protein